MVKRQTMEQHIKSGDLNPINTVIPAEETNEVTVVHYPHADMITCPLCHKLGNKDTIDDWGMCLACEHVKSDIASQKQTD